MLEIYDEIVSTFLLLFIYFISSVHVHVIKLLNDWSNFDKIHVVNSILCFYELCIFQKNFIVCLVKKVKFDVIDAQIVI